MLSSSAHSSACAVTLCDLAHYPSESNAALHWFHVLPLGVAIVPGSRLTSLLLTMPWIGKADFFSCKAEPRIDIVQAIPITEAERSLFQTEGVDALEEALEDTGADLTDLYRLGAR